MNEDSILILGGGHDEGFSREIYEYKSDQIITFAYMENGKDLRNKCVIYENLLYTIGGNYYKAEYLNLVNKQWNSID